MYKLFNIANHKTNIKGFWLDKGKVCIDNIVIKNYAGINLFNSNKKHLFRQGEKEVFYIKSDKAYIENMAGEVTILKHCIRYTEKHLSIKYIRLLLKQHTGLTIYRRYNQYVIEIWRP